MSFYRDGGRSENLEGASTKVGGIISMVEIGLTDL